MISGSTILPSCPANSALLPSAQVELGRHGMTLINFNPTQVSDHQPRYVPYVLSNLPLLFSPPFFPAGTGQEEASVETNSV